MIVDLFDFQEIDWCPSQLEAVPVHIAELSRGFRRCRVHLRESTFSELLNLDQRWGVNHADALNRSGDAIPENLEMAISLPGHRLRKKCLLSKPPRRPMFFALRWSDPRSAPCRAAGKAARK